MKIKVPSTSHPKVRIEVKHAKGESACVVDNSHEEVEVQLPEGVCEADCHIVAKIQDNGNRVVAEQLIQEAKPKCRKPKEEEAKEDADDGDKEVAEGEAEEKADEDLEVKIEVKSADAGELSDKIKGKLHADVEVGKGKPSHLRKKD